MVRFPLSAPTGAHLARLALGSALGVGACVVIAAQPALAPAPLTPATSSLATTAPSGWAPHLMSFSGEAAYAAALVDLGATAQLSFHLIGDTVPPVSGVAWVRTELPALLWSSAQDNASVFTDLPFDSLLQVVGPAEGNRLPVFYFGDGLFRQAGRAWVAKGAVASTTAPAPGQVPALDAAAGSLPTWVQAHRATRLWSGPDEKAQPLTDLPQWSYLRVVGAGRDGRVLVQYDGDFVSKAPGVGWVDQAAVGPSGDPGHWVQNHRLSTLWSGPDGTAQRFTDLPQWSRLRLVAGAPSAPDRVMVEYFGDGAIRQAGTAWVARGDVGPIAAPTPLPAQAAPGAATATGRRPNGRVFVSQDDFITTVGAAAQHSQQTWGVPASVTVAQAILESDWGRSRLTRQGNNLFGIKALASPGSAGVVTLPTWEFLEGENVIIEAAFKAYNSLEDSVDDHGRFFRGRNYRAAMAVTGDPRAFAEAIADAGYATDPAYAAKLVGLMDRYNLYRFDVGWG